MSISHGKQEEGTVVSHVNEAFIAMQDWPHWAEIQRGAQKEYGMTVEAFYNVLPEYQRFMALNAGYRGLGMLSEQVDQIWHSHILNTIRYREYCDHYIGRFVDHLPCSSYELYGFSSDEAQRSICKEPPATCTDPFPAPPDPSPVPPKVAQYERIQTSILEGSPLFVSAYTRIYGHTPPDHIWERMSFVADGIAS
jgi:hypothetical protein